MIRNRIADQYTTRARTTGISLALLASSTFICPIWITSAHAAAKENSAPVALSAQEVTHDKTLNIVTARGSVEINQNGQTLFADTVSYNVNQDTATASGNVSLISPSGEVIFADHMNLTGKMKQGAMENLLMVTADHSRAAAKKGKRYTDQNGRQINELDHAVYSPCDNCKKQRNPLWQIKAIRVIHDEDDKSISYHHAFLEMYGIPIAYFPYLSHADPTVKRRSGLLIPTVGSSSNLGWFYKQPYYWVTSDHSDVTLAPIIAEDSPSIMTMEYRQNLADAQFKLDASARVGGERDDYTSTDIYGNKRTVKGEDAQMGHINFAGEWHINDTLRASAELHATSSDTYLERYRLPGDEDTQTSVVALEAFAGDDYAKIDTLAFRELRSLSNPTDNPYAVPRLEWNHTSQPGSKGGYWSSKLSSVTLMHKDGQDSNRISGMTSWNLPYIAPTGEHYTLTTSLRGDLYNVRDYERDDTSTFDGTTGRIIPEASIRWSWPFSSAGEKTTQVVEPVIVGTVSPRGGNPDDIPNEDSVDFEFDAANALSTNHFVGYDRVETGPRVAYGLNWNAYQNTSTTKLSAFLGQTYRVFSDSIFDEKLGIKEGFSDLVGSLRYDYNSNLSTEYRYRINESNFDVVSHDLKLSGGINALRGSVGYLNQKSRTDYTTGDVEDVEQIDLSLSSHLSKYWSISASTSHNLVTDSSSSGPLSFTGNATYEDECFKFILTGQNDYTADRDDEDGFSFMAMLVFKSLGEVGTSF